MAGSTKAREESAPEGALRCDMWFGRGGDRNQSERNDAR